MKKDRSGQERLKSLLKERGDEHGSKTVKNIHKLE
jgi:hypothetical protein